MKTFESKFKGIACIWTSIIMVLTGLVTLPIIMNNLIQNDAGIQAVTWYPLVYVITIIGWSIYIGLKGINLLTERKYTKKETK